MHPINRSRPGRRLGALIAGATLSLLSVGGGLWGAPLQAAPEPRLISVFPLAASAGTRVEAVLRGIDLQTAVSVWFGSDGLAASIRGVEDLPRPLAMPEAAPPEGSRATHKILVQFEITSSVAPGTYQLRVVTAGGLSNALSFHVHRDRVTREIARSHSRPASAQTVQWPVAVQGTVGSPGERDYYAFQVQGGQKLSFELITSLEAVSNNKRFRPQLSLYEAAGSWFDPERASRLAFDDSAMFDSVRASPFQPVPVSRLSHRFDRAGRYLIEVASVFGTGEADFVYQLRLWPEEGPSQPTSSGLRVYKQVPLPNRNSGWEERSFTRRLEADRLWSLRLRTVATDLSVGPDPPGARPTSGNLGARVPDDEDPEWLAATEFSILAEAEPNDGPGQAPSVPLPALLEGTIDEPGDVDKFSFQVAAGGKIAFEIETPEAAPLRFNPRLEVLDGRGRVTLTNLHKQVLLKDSTESIKALEPKIIHTFEKGGRYSLRMRDVTFRHGGPDFRYRVLVRPQIPHMGAVILRADYLNLVRGGSKKLVVSAEHEEGFQGDVAIAVEGLPEGVRTLPTGTEVEKSAAARSESPRGASYLPSRRETALLFFASESVPVTNQPFWIHVSAQPVVSGKAGLLLPIGKILLMIVEGREAPETTPPTTNPK